MVMSFRRSTTKEIDVFILDTSKLGEKKLDELLAELIALLIAYSSLAWISHNRKRSFFLWYHIQKMT